MITVLKNHRNEREKRSRIVGGLQSLSREKTAAILRFLFLMLLSLFVVIGTLLSDLALAALDPRIRFTGGTTR